MSEGRPGYYKDKYGNWQRDRRKSERRSPQGEWSKHERRRGGRRREDRDLDRDHNAMIEEALSDFANSKEESDGDPS